LINCVLTTDPKRADIDRQASSAIQANGPHIFTQPPWEIFFGSTLVRNRCD